MSIILMRPPPVSTQGTHVSDVITPGTTKNVDSVLSNSTHTIKWLLTITDPLNNKASASIILAISLPSGVKHNRHAIVGDNLNYSVDVTYNAPYINLQITNNESASINSSSIRFETL